MGRRIGWENAEFSPKSREKAAVERSRAGLLQGRTVRIRGDEAGDRDGKYRGRLLRSTTNQIIYITNLIGIRIPMLSILFGSPLREKILLYLLECDEAYSLELSKNFEASLYAVQNQLRRLEEAGILASRTAGKTRLYSLNPRYFLRQELEALLRKDFQALPEEDVRAYYRPRKRPRRAGKPS
jgi:DNA-binding transcriptional ArsR family regulator